MYEPYACILTSHARDLFFYLLISLHLEEVTVVMTISGSLYALYGSTWLRFVVAMLLAAVVVDYISVVLHHALLLIFHTIRNGDSNAT